VDPKWHASEHTRDVIEHSSFAVQRSLQGVLQFPVYSVGSVTSPVTSCALCVLLAQDMTSLAALWGAWVKAEAGGPPLPSPLLEECKAITAIRAQVRARSTLHMERT
jgi:hypothetical protein